jgi:hypothetical protein
MLVLPVIRRRGGLLSLVVLLFLVLGAPCSSCSCLTTYANVYVPDNQVQFAVAGSENAVLSVFGLTYWTMDRADVIYSWFPTTEPDHKERGTKY